MTAPTKTIARLVGIFRSTIHVPPTTVWRVAVWIATWTVSPLHADSVDDALRELPRTIQQGVPSLDTQKQWKILAAAEPTAAARLLSHLRPDQPVVANWIRAAVESVLERAIRDGSFPQQELERFFLDHSQPARARRMAYEQLIRVNPELSARWLPEALQDPSLEMRRDAVKRVLDAANALRAQEDQTPDATHEASVKAFETALTHGRDLDQVNLAAEALRELGRPVNLTQHFGFLTQWQLAGPFENRNRVGLAMALPPESDARVWNTPGALEGAQPYAGLDGDVNWQDLTSTDEMGMIDLNKAIAARKEVLAYARAVFTSTHNGPAQLRLTSLNANKVWVNGTLVLENNVYHAGSELDQYIAPIHIRPGANVILVKLCQNEQTEPWAEPWSFQCRICDDVGTPIPEMPSPSSN